MTDKAGTPVFIGIGSNLDDPRTQVRAGMDALAALPGSRLLTCSSWYCSRALGPAQPDFINAVALLRTNLAAHALLDQLQAIEQRQGRVRTARWGPRTIDLDILLYGQWQIRDERLTVPHPEMSRRNFVLMPLVEIAPELTLPDGQSAAALLANCPSDGIVRLSPGGCSGQAG